MAVLEPGREDGRLEGSLAVDSAFAPISDVRDMQRLMVEDVIGRSTTGACGVVASRRMQAPVATAGKHRREELEAMTNSITRELEHHDDPAAPSRFRAAAEELMTAEVRLG